MKQLTLRQWRVERQLTQEQLVTRCAETPTARRKNLQLTQAAISGIEVGKVLNPKWDTVRVLAEALEIDPRELRFDDDAPQQKTA